MKKGRGGEERRGADSGAGRQRIIDKTGSLLSSSPPFFHFEKGREQEKKKKRQKEAASKHLKKTTATAVWCVCSYIYHQLRRKLWQANTENTAY